MKTLKFNCNGNNAPTYSCSEHGDNSGEYVELTELKNSQQETQWASGDWSISRHDEGHVSIDGPFEHCIITDRDFKSALSVFCRHPFRWYPDRAENGRECRAENRDD